MLVISKSSHLTVDERAKEMAARSFGIRLGARLFSSSSTSVGASSSAPSSASRSDVGVQDFLRAVGRGVEVHAEKVAKEAGSLSNFLRFRGGCLKGLGIPCKQRKLILRYTEKYRQGTWSPKVTTV